jgi:hypothetical protein
MKADEFVGLAASQWPNIPEKEYGGLREEEALQMRDLEKNFRQFMLTDLFNFCSKISDKLQFADAYRKAKRQMVSLATEVPDHPSLSAKANQQAREIEQRHMGALLDCMAIWFSTMPGSEPVLAKQKVTDSNELFAIRHKEIENYGVGTLRGTPSKQTNQAPVSSNVPKAGCAVLVVVAGSALGSVLYFLCGLMA